MRWLGVALAFAACRPELPEPAVAPAAPTLRLANEPLFFTLTTTLWGDAAPGTQVRVFVDDACAGPMLLEVAAEALAAGVEVRLVHGENVFTAQVVSPEGARSSCASPVRATRETVFAPASPVVRVLPKDIAATRDFTLRGSIRVHDRVRLHDSGNCTGDVLEELSEHDFATRGFPVQGIADQWRTMSLDAVNPLGQVSPCSSAWFFWDNTPPQLTLLDFGSPNPSGASAMYVHVEPFGTCVRVFDGPGCTGEVLRECDGGDLFVLPVPARASWAWSAEARDGAGHSVCRDGPTFHYDARLTRQAVELAVAGQRLFARVPVNVERVQLFDEPDCRGLVRLETSAYGIGVGLLLSPQRFGPTVSARGRFFDGAWGPCSAPLTLP